MINYKAMKKIILLGLMLVSFVGYSQVIDENDSDEGEVVIYETHTVVQLDEQEFDENHIYNAVEIMPEYTDGGINGFRQFVSKNYQNPDVSHDLKGHVIVQFVIEKDGSLSNFKILRELGYGTGAEAINVLKKAKKWKPGFQNGKPARVLFNFPMILHIKKTNH